MNCRKWKKVWSDPEVAKMLTQDVVLVSLCVDDRPHFESEQVSRNTAERTRSKPLQQVVLLAGPRFGRNAQPFYVMIDHDGNHIGAPDDPDAGCSSIFSKTACPNSTIDFQLPLGNRMPVLKDANFGT